MSERAEIALVKQAIDNRRKQQATTNELSYSNSFEFRVTQYYQLCLNYQLSESDAISATWYKFSYSLLPIEFFRKVLQGNQ